MKSYKQFMAETDSRMYGDDSVIKGKGKPKPPCKGKDCDDKKKPKPFMGYEQVDTDPCWDGYRQEGMKKKGDRMVPNCVPMTEERREESQLTEKKIGGTMGGHAGIDFGDAMPTFTKGAQSVARTITRLRRKPGDVWDTHLGEWGGKSPSGEIRYFKKEFDAEHWARTGRDINASK